MKTPIDPKITDKNQGHPADSTYERLFLEGVQEEALHQGYKDARAKRARRVHHSGVL